MKKLIGKDDYHGAKVYNKNGVLIFESDFNLLHNGDILYLASKGEDFSYAAMLDDYELGKTLGVGGFGKVILGEYRANIEKITIKHIVYILWIAQNRIIREKKC